MYVIARILTTIALFHLGLCMDLPAPVHLVLSSQYFVHLLSWKMGPGSPDGVHYTVSVHALNRGEVVVKECEKVTFPLQCNLTKAFSDLEDTYYVSVSAALGNLTSPSSFCNPFKPIYNTTFEPPLLTVTTCNQSLCISLRAPAENLYRVYNSFKFYYRLMVSSEDRAEFHVDTEGLKSVTLKDLAPGRRYCVNVSIIDHSPPNRPAVCASTPERANVSDAIISVILCLLMVLLVMCTPRFVSHCFCLKRDLPSVLSSFKSGNKVLLVTAGEYINNLCEERNSIEKIKTNREENDMEEEAEEVLKYERLAARYLDTRGSPLSVFPMSSSSVLFMNQTPDTSLTSFTDAQSGSLIVFEGSHIHTEPTASPRLPKGASALQNLSSVFPTHVENEDRESSADVNLFSVMLGGVSDKAEPDKTCTTENVQESCRQHLLQTCATSTWISDSQSQNSQKSIQMNVLEEEDDDADLGYLSRN
ncbi:cytokine receptor family member b2 isoform X2 [Sinocyclocheilus anshuiensis]|uniref:Interferon alpha/beta receptor 2-like n=1 Tax=Sinocyclocheilus anshuiensis TaxID=1608454 RepID=A0A671LMB2_9TELE|nr:PREDICTED: interferon alpha/beta receptor 2-like isoform X2 [Sinocyclocheilus anshuiensis]